MATSTRKKVAMILVGVFFVAAWIASYPSTGGNTTTTVQTTIAAQQVFVSGIVNGLVSGYVNASTISLQGQAANRSDAVSVLLTRLKANGSIYDFVPLSNNFRVFNASMGLYALQGLVYNAVSNGTIANITSVVGIDAQMRVRLPQQVEMSSFGQQFPVRFSAPNYSISVSHITPIGSTIKLQARALAYAVNGTVSNVTLSIS